MPRYTAKFRVTVDVEVSFDAPDDKQARITAFSGNVDWSAARPGPLPQQPSQWAVVGDPRREGEQ